jgi:glycosyltransferase involved in cell wall biosynthesis
MNSQAISIVIPVYNESKAIENVLKELREFLKSTDLENEIICVDDCSTDNSAKVISKVEGVELIKHKRNKGYGAALKTGILSAKNRVILIMDSDGQHNVSDIPKIIEPLSRGYKMSVGSRKITNTKKNRILGKILINKLANYFVDGDILDINSGFRCFYKDEAEVFFHLCSDQFSFTTSMTMAYFQEGKDVKYIPISVNDRSSGKSQVSYRSGLQALLKILQVVIVFRPLKVFVPIIIFTLFLAIASLINDVIRGNISDVTTLLSITTLLLFVFSLISDQISTLRRELWIK